MLLPIVPAFGGARIIRGWNPLPALSASAQLSPLASLPKLTAPHQRKGGLGRSQPLQRRFQSKPWIKMGLNGR